MNHNNKQSYCSCTNEETVTNSPSRVAIGGDFALVDQDGRAVNRQTYQGKFILIFFGFTHCRVVCPKALDFLGVKAQRIAALYISVDPKRDTPRVMKEFLHGEYSGITGLTGTGTQIDEVKAKFRVFAKQADDPDATGGYVVPHTALTYLLDQRGDYLAHFSDAISAAELAAQLEEHLAMSGRQRGEKHMEI